MTMRVEEAGRDDPVSVASSHWHTSGKLEDKGLRGTNRRIFWAAKRAFDVAFGLYLLPLLICVSIVLFCINPYLNAGPLIFKQLRMGRNGQPFWFYKFRTMKPVSVVSRDYQGALETDRITPLGHWLRRTRFDELPQIINIIRGEMSFVGPRPHAYDHAVEYMKRVPNYQKRYAVRPGLSGLSQVHLGYAEGLCSIRGKVRMDLIYVRNACFGLELLIMTKTVLVVITGRGAR